MTAFSYVSYKHHRDERILQNLRAAIFVLKLDAQNLSAHAQAPDDVQTSRKTIADVLSKLQAATKFLIQTTHEEIDIAYLSIARRFIDINPDDVLDRIDELDRLKRVSIENKAFQGRHFQLLDRIQSLLEAETSDAVKNFYKF